MRCWRAPPSCRREPLTLRARRRRPSRQINTALQNNGYYRGQIAQTKVIDRENSLVDLNFEITTGNPGPHRRRRVDRRQRSDRSPVSQAGKLKRNCQGQPQHGQPRTRPACASTTTSAERLAATVSLTSKEYVPPINRLNYTFLAHQGPLVQVKVEGAKISRGTLQKLVPVYEEGTVDQDLLNEGAQNLRNYYREPRLLRCKGFPPAGAHRSPSM